MEEVATAANNRRFREADGKASSASTLPSCCRPLSRRTLGSGGGVEVVIVVVVVVVVLVGMLTTTTSSGTVEEPLSPRVATSSGCSSDNVGAVFDFDVVVIAAVFASFSPDAPGLRGDGDNGTSDGGGGGGGVVGVGFITARRISMCSGGGRLSTRQVAASCGSVVTAPPLSLPFWATVGWLS